MAVTFTPDQQRVIDTRDRNILVSAAAGSGKTAVLVERIIQKICDESKPVDIDRLLIVTFTSAAAAQMRERISKAVMKKLEEQPENEHLQRQAALIHNAQITTIDSFCLFVIRNSFNAIGLDPGFRVADEGEIKLTESDTLAKLLEDEFALGRERFLQFVECYSTGVGEQKIEEAILRLYHFSISYPFPEEWLQARKNDYRVSSIAELNQKPWFKEALRFMDTVLTECQSRIRRAMELAGGIGGPLQYMENLEDDYQLIERLRETKNQGYEALFDAFTYLTFTTLSRKKGEGVDPTIKDVVKGIRDEVKKTIGDLKKQLFLISPENTLADMQVCQEVVEELVDLTLAFKERLDQTKRDKNIVDFSDMEHFALQILLEKDENGNIVQRETALELQDYFEEIMIDEYQDSNEVQELLLQSISGESKQNYNRFMVGDVKQSIYKFRLARPEIFMEKYHAYEIGNQEEQVRIDLSMNFRSRREVTDATNYICGQIMKKEVGNVEYDEKAALYVGASYPQPTEENLYQTELLIATPGEEETKLTSRELEAYMVAQRIKELVGQFPVKDEDGEEDATRPARYSDIVLLFRATAGWDEDFRKILAEQGIPVHISSKTGYFETLEIQGIVHFLRTLDNPLQDIPFFGVLKLPFFEFTEEEVAHIKCVVENVIREQNSKLPEDEQQSQKLFLYEKVSRYAEFVQNGVLTQESDILVAKVNKLLITIQVYRAKVAYTPIKELIQEIIRDTGYAAYIGAMPGGAQRQANLELLLEKAGAFEKTSFYGLFHFIRYLETMQDQEVDFGEANILDEHADVVRIMTIHKSKGLEFPICFVCGLSKQFNMMDTRQGILMDVEMGIGVDCIDPVLRTKRKTLRKNVVAQRMKEDTRGEDLRVFYVALTRAKEKLILTGYQEDMEKKMKNNLYISLEQEQKLPFSVMMNATTYMDLCIAACIRHRMFTPLLEEFGMAQGSYQLPYEEIPMKLEFWQYAEDGVKELQELGKAAMLEEALEHTADYVDAALAKGLQEKLLYAYPHENLTGLTVKTTVSELKKEGSEEVEESVQELFPMEKESYIPSFMKQEEEMLGTQYGTAVHKVMELFSFDESYQRQPQEDDMTYQKRVKPLVQAEREQWITDGIVAKEDIACVRNEKIITFLQSSLAQRMIIANGKGQLYKEQPFVIGIPAKERDEKFPEEETMLIQGVIDAFFYEDEEIILMDYKTDRVETGQELITRYRIQLDYYQRALQMLTEKQVKQKIIYAFRLAEEIEVE